MRHYARQLAVHFDLRPYAGPTFCVQYGNLAQPLAPGSSNININSHEHAAYVGRALGTSTASSMDRGDVYPRVELTLVCSVHWLVWSVPLSQSSVLD